MKTKPDSKSLDASSESGSALVVALLIMVIMTLLGLAFVLTGETEAKIARNHRDVAQAGFVSEGGVRMVKKWFEAPSGTFAYQVPTVSQMNRSLRWVDEDNDGTYAAYSSATAPWNVVYRQGSDDPFEKPYRGTPASAFNGTEDHPDIRISATGSSGEQTYLTSLNAALYPTFPTTGQRAKVTQIDVYSPPILTISGQRIRYGIATVKVTSGVFEFTGTAQERLIASRVTKAVLNELPYTAPGAIQSCGGIDVNGDAAAHWGRTTAVTTLNLHSNLNVKVNSSVPYTPSMRFITRDMNLDGTLLTGSAPDDQDSDGTLDFDEWASGPDVEDPWLRFESEGNVTSGGSSLSPDCVGTDCQPMPWFTSPSTFGSGTNDHSNIFKNVSHALCPTFEYELWKGVAQSGAPNAYYYSSDGPGTGTFKLNGSGASVTMPSATNLYNGLFFFDTNTNSPPVDADGNGTFDNLTNSITINGGSWTTGGFIYLNADFSTTGNGSAAYQRQLIAPAEPYVDSNANGQYDDTEYFIDLNYPGSYGGDYHINAMRRVVDGFTRQDPSKDGAADGKWNAYINLYGLLFTNGVYAADGNWMYFGSVITKTGFPLPSGLSGTPDFYYDERMIKGTWPPPELGLPRTMITAWQTE